MGKNVAIMIFYLVFADVLLSERQEVEIIMYQTHKTVNVFLFLSLNDSIIVCVCVCVCVCVLGGIRERSGSSVQPDGAHSQPPCCFRLQPHRLSTGCAALLHDQLGHGACCAPQLSVSINTNTQL